MGYHQSAWQTQAHNRKLFGIRATNSFKGTNIHLHTKIRTQLWCAKYEKRMFCLPVSECIHIQLHAVNKTAIGKGINTMFLRKKGLLLQGSVIVKVWACNLKVTRRVPELPFHCWAHLTPGCSEGTVLALKML